jgi:integrase
MTGIKKLKSGRYQARYFAGYDGRGRRIDPSKTFSHYGDAVKWRTAKIREKDLGQQIELSRESIADYLNAWLEFCEKRLRHNTVKGYRQAVRCYIIPYLGELILQQLKPIHLDRWQTELLSLVDNSTARQARAVLNTALNRAVKLRSIYLNPLKATDAPRKGKSRAQALNAVQRKDLEKACEGTRWGLSYRFVMETGLRPEEMFGLTWGALELDGRYGVCHVRKVVIRHEGGGWHFDEPKTIKGFRQIMFSSRLAQELKAYRVAQLQDRMAAGTAWHDLDLVFASSIGTPVNQGDHSNEFRKIVVKAGLPKGLRLYDLRHTFATICLQAEVDYKTLSDEMGHANVAFTLDTYTHVLKEMKEDAAEKRERLLRGTK